MATIVLPVPVKSCETVSSQMPASLTWNHLLICVLWPSLVCLLVCKSPGRVLEICLQKRNKWKCLKIDVSGEGGGCLWWCHHHNVISSADLLLWVSGHLAVSCRVSQKDQLTCFGGLPLLEWANIIYHVIKVDRCDLRWPACSSPDLI